ncbi:MAG: hypothetical protein F6K35_34955 [Okeania sp. SIO2H7]|nr:hypothetical protein [Okeania sp. SIO2H7]
MEDRELREYALEAQRHPPRSLQQQKSLTKLVEGILRSGRIAYPRRGQFPEFYDEIHNEAIQKTTFYLCQNIDKYDPKRAPVIRWFNYLLERRFFPEAIPEIVGTSKIVASDNAALDRFPADDNSPPLLSEQLREYLQEDPEGLLKKLKHKVYDGVNFFDLVSRRMAGQKWKDISADLGGIPTSTLSDFYQRSLKKIAPQIQHYLES